MGGRRLQYFVNRTHLMKSRRQCSQALSKISRKYNCTQLRDQCPALHVPCNAETAKTTGAERFARRSVFCLKFCPHTTIKPPSHSHQLHRVSRKNDSHSVDEDPSVHEHSSVAARHRAVNLVYCWHLVTSTQAAAVLAAISWLLCRAPAQPLFQGTTQQPLHTLQLAESEHESRTRSRKLGEQAIGSS